MLKSAADAYFFNLVMEMLREIFEQNEYISDEIVYPDSLSKDNNFSNAIEVTDTGNDFSEVLTLFRNGVLENNARTDHPRFFSFIPGPASLISWYGDIISTAFNIHAATWNNAKGAVSAESSVINWLGKKIGYKAGFGGDFVSGGSIANLTALTIARDAALGACAISDLTTYLSREAHSSVAKALRIIGIPYQNIRWLEVNDDFEINVEHFKDLVKKDKESGFNPFLVIASAGTTNTGAIDPFEEIYDVCVKNGIWMHVDGAYGASVSLSSTHSKLLDGIQLADSISWDAHKWLFQTYGLGIILVKDRRNLFNSFNTSPEYLEDVKSKEELINPCDQSIELTRTSRGLKLWFTLKVLGSKKIGNWIDIGFDRSEYFYKLLSQQPQWEILSGPQLCIVNFRFAPPGISEDRLDDLNQRISQRVLERGLVAIHTTKLNSKKVLRVALINPETTNHDVVLTIRELNLVAREIFGS